MERRHARSVWRFAGERDLDAIDRIEEICFREHRFRREFLEWVLGNPNARTLVWDESDRIVGSVMILLSGKRMRVLTIAVLPRFRRRGIGDALLDAAERTARGLGARTARLEVSTKNRSAIAMYRRRGYRTDVVLPAYYSWGDDALAMEKTLDTNA